MTGNKISIYDNYELVPLYSPCMFYHMEGEQSHIAMLQIEQRMLQNPVIFCETSVCEFL